MASGIRPRLGVCSWSLQPASPAELVAHVRAVGLSAVQLHLDPIRRREWQLDHTIDSLERAGIRIVSGMMSMKDEDYSTLESIKATGGVRPGTTWNANLEAAAANAVVARQLDIPLVTFHAGFLPHDPRDDERHVMIGRLRELARVFARCSVRVALETGQESAETLRIVLDDINSGLTPDDHVRVNFDPANMLLYGMGDPVAALRLLAPHVAQVHIKDATPSRTPGRWGEEVPVGKGAVDWPAFLAALNDLRPECPLMIEREAGAARIDDIRAAVDVITRTYPAGAMR